MEPAYKRGMKSEIAYDRMEDALAYIAAHWMEQPSLGEIASAVGMSEFHFQRVFTRWVGISPKKFLGKITIEQAKRQLEHASSVLDATFEAGLSGPARLHDLFVTYEAMSPGEYKKFADGLTITWGWSVSPFGRVLIMTTDRGICGLAFADFGGEGAALEDMQARWPKAHFVRDDTLIVDIAGRIFHDQADLGGGKDASLRFLLKGTKFQIKVWEALMALPEGALVTYGDLARRIGCDQRAARAVGTAVGANPISWLIPCHRVIRTTGALGGYRWGLPRKIAMLGVEACKADGILPDPDLMKQPELTA